MTLGKSVTDKSKAARQFIEFLPHAKALGMEFVAMGEATTTIAMNYDEKLVGDPETGVISGGAVSALMDTCCGAAVLTHPDAPALTATIDLRIDYMRSATPGQRLEATAEVYHMTRSVAFVRAKTFDDDKENPVATATGAFTVERKL